MASSSNNFYPKHTSSTSISFASPPLIIHRKMKLAISGLLSIALASKTIDMGGASYSQEDLSMSQPADMSIMSLFEGMIFLKEGVDSLRKTSKASKKGTKSMKSSKSPSYCTDTPDWKDSYGDGCDWYEDNERPGCPKYGYLNDGGMGVADDNCCHCFGTGVSGCSIFHLIPSCMYIVA